MNAPLASSPCPGAAHLTDVQMMTLRALLFAARHTHGAAVSRHEAKLARSAVDTSVDTADLDRALCALEMYVAWETVEAIDAALARIDTGAYGMCRACARPIPYERLAAKPYARFCPTCRESSRPHAAGVAGGGRP
jgi:RNA polymerase-binding transcription factor DksA